MISISEYYNDFKKAKKNYSNKLKNLEKEESQYKKIETEFEESKEELINIGLLYFDEEKRQKLIKDARDLCYSNSELVKIEEMGNNWNKDSVNDQLIYQLITIEDYVNGKKTYAQKSVFAKFGEMINEIIDGGYNQ